KKNGIQYKTFPGRDRFSEKSLETVGRDSLRENGNLPANSKPTWQPESDSGRSFGQWKKPDFNYNSMPSRYWGRWFAHGLCWWTPPKKMVVGTRKSIATAIFILK